MAQESPSCFRLGDLAEPLEAYAQEKRTPRNRIVRAALKEYLRPKKLASAEVLERLAVEAYELRVGLDRIGQNLNQVTIELHTLEYLDGPRYERLCDEIHKKFKHVMDRLEEMRDELR